MLLLWGLSGTLDRTTQAAASVYVRPGGNDTACSGAVDADYSASIAPFCAVATISRALQLADTGGVVNVAAGQYLLGTVDITRAVTLNGPNALISPNAGVRAPEAVLTGADARLRLTGNTVANITIQGFTFQTVTGTLSSSGVIQVSSTSGVVSNLTFARNRFIDIRNRHAIWASLPATTPGQNWLVTDNRVDTVNACSVGQTCHAFSLGNVNALTVTDNVIRNVTAGAGLLLLNNQEALIASNILTDTRDGLRLSGTAQNVTIADNSVTQASGDGLFLQGSAFTGPVSVLRNTLTETGRAVNVSGAINHSFLQLRYNTFTGSLTNTLYFPGTLAGVVEATCNWYGHLSGPAFSGNPGGLGQSVVVTTTGAGELRFRPWLMYGTDGQAAQAGWQAPASFTVAALNGGFSAADNNYRRLANAFGCVTSGQTISISGNFDWTEANAQAAFAAGPDGNPATTGDNLRLSAPGGVNDVTVSGPASIHGGANAGRFLPLAGDNDRWRFSGLSLLNFSTGLDLSARAVLTGTTFLNSGSFTSSGSGVVLRSGAAVTVTNGSFNQLGLGLEVSGGEALVAHTVFAGNGVGVRVQGAGLADLGNTDPDDPANLTALGASAGCNNFIGNTLAVSNLTAVEIEAEGNWWGLPLGPGALPGVDFTPFRTRPCFTHGVYLPLIQR
jgi:hypothetical protein